MADQATLKRRDGASSNGAATARPTSDPKGADSNTGAGASNGAGFGENFLTLAELQVRLTAVELRQNLESVKTGGALMLAGSILAISGLPVLMLGIAELLVSELGMKRGYALLSTAAAAFMIAGCSFVLARRWLGRKPLGFPVASEEFNRNLIWLRTILRHRGRRPLNR